MSDSGYLSARREKQLAKILDASIDFDKLLQGKKKFLGIINIGSALERNDRRLFQILIAYLDDNILGDNAAPETITSIETAISILENHDIAGFIDYVAELAAGKINLPIFGHDKTLFVLALQMLAGIIGKAVAKIEELNDKANEEDNK